MKRHLFFCIPLMVVLGAAPATVSAAPTRTTERALTIPAGTLLHLRIDTSIGSDISRVEQPIRAEVTRPVVVHGQTALPAGSIATGHVVAARRAGHLKERSMVSVRFSEVKPRGEEESFPIRTRSWSALGPTLRNRDLEGIGIPAAGGAVIGGLLGGAKGAGIGAAVGGGAGAGRLMVTRGKNVRVARGSLITVRLAQPVHVEVPTVARR